MNENYEVIGSKTPDEIRAMSFEQYRAQYGGTFESFIALQTPGPYVWEVESARTYENLKRQLLDAAEDCDKRGHTKTVGQRFRDAADICDRAGSKP